MVTKFTKKKVEIINEHFIDPWNETTELVTRFSLFTPLYGVVETTVIADDKQRSLCGYFEK